MSKNNISGVYSIRNKINNKLYVGSSKSVYYRWKSQHRKDLRAGNHYNKHLQHAWDKYGEDAFEFQVIEECEESVLVEKEEYWIEQHKSWNRQYGYNLNRIAGGRAIISQETKQAIGESQSRAYKDPEYQQLRAKIMSNTWNEKKQEISEKIRLAWATEETRKRHEEGYTEEAKLKMSSASKTWWEENSRPILQLTIEGELVKEWSSPMSAIQEYGRHVSSVLNGKRLHTRGFVFRYKDVT